MVRGYFGDMDELIQELHRLLKPGGAAYVNVAESAYCGIRIPTLELLAALGRRSGFAADVINVRSIRRSAQQFHKVTHLHEGVVLLQK